MTTQSDASPVLSGPNVRAGSLRPRLPLMLGMLLILSASLTLSTAAIGMPRIVLGEVIVRFKPGISNKARDQSLAMVGGVYASTFQLPQGGKIVVARVPVGTEMESAQSLTIDTNVLAAQPNAVHAPR